MVARLNPYLNFRTNARSALEYYQQVFGGSLAVSTFGEYGLQNESGSNAGLVMHGQLEAPNGIVLMAADVPEHMPFNEGGSYSVSLSGGAEDEAELRRCWALLTDGGTVHVGLEKAPWGDTFGMCADRFGINWLVNIAGA